jgi:hypothetical protein
MCVCVSHAQINYTKAVTITAPLPNTVDLSIENTTEYIAQQQIVLTAGFEVKAVGSSPSKYYLAKINQVVLNMNVQYAVLTKDLSNSYVSTLNDKLYFKYDEKYVATGNLNYKIYAYDRKQVAPLPLLIISNIGTNFFQINMDGIVGSITTSDEQNYYVLEVTNSKNEKWLLRFKYVQEK